ncbi:MAG: hypothetical protein ACR2JB_03865 [Bryobacteraceae bacterium]
MAVGLILTCGIPDGCGSPRIKGTGVSLGNGESVSFEAIGNYAFSRGRIELWFRPHWDSHARGEQILFQTGSRHLKAQIAFRDGRFRLEMTKGVLSEAPAISFTTGEPLYIVANYDYPGRNFRIFVNGNAGSEDPASHAPPELDWAGVPFRIYAGPRPVSSGTAGFTLLRLRTGGRPLLASTITANLARLRREQELEPDSDTLLDLLFDRGTKLRRGCGDIAFERKTSMPAISPPTPLPPLDSVLPQVEKPDSWLISDSHWKAHPGAQQGATWKDAGFSDRDWKNAIVRTPEAQRRLGKTYLYSSNPHHAKTSAAEWIGFDQGREGSLRRAFVLSRGDIKLLKKEPGTLYVSAGDRFDCFVNGRWVGTNGGHFRPGYGDVPEITTYWQIPQTLNIADLVQEGTNIIAVQLRHDFRMSTDEREGLFLDWRKGPFQSARIDWSASPGDLIVRPATLDLREPALRSMEYHLNTDFKSVLVEKGGIFYGWSYGDTLGRALEATVLLRLMTGIDRFPDAERQLMQGTLQTFTHDGWSYRELAPHVAPELAIPGSMPYACMWDQAEVLFGLVTWYEKTRSPVLRNYIEGLLAALKRNALPAGDTYHVPEEFWDGRQWVTSRVWFNPGAVLLDPIAHYYEISRSSIAWEVLQGLYRSQKERLGA